jgi:hypothetical protein
MIDTSPGGASWVALLRAGIETVGTTSSTWARSPRSATSCDAASAVIARSRSALRASHVERSSIVAPKR